MINYLSSNLSVSIYQFNYSEINATGSKNYVWNKQLIVFGVFYNYLDDNFSQLNLLDNSGNHILHTAGTHQNCYSIGFSGSSTGNVLFNNQINDMSGIQFNWTIGPVTTGSLIVKLYYV